MTCNPRRCASRASRTRIAYPQPAYSFASSKQRLFRANGWTESNTMTLSTGLVLISRLTAGFPRQLQTSILLETNHLTGVPRERLPIDIAHLERAAPGT